MKIGIISDTHDTRPAIHEAIRLFSSLEIDHLLHAGDITSPESLHLFSALPCPVTAVLGNCDRDRSGLGEVARRAGNISIPGRSADLTIDGTRIGMMHGDDPLSLIAAAEAGCFDIIITGHTHRASIRRSGDTLLINPGEASGERYGEATVALLDTERNDVEIIIL
ncbi:hypothetical protein RJ53_10175 [Methanocalculus chunghsingensis]|uniref:Phosphoesterase n=1 Tax=Methanocalculus chunghsingensis TaxID=156457 RepID=A0A8J8B7M3_9EURY|nr:metallophosphoesterase [Methanocalculus chunghsingensis]MBR1369822.1 hypothetical protein [Methanocalculus chunghsingensis]